MHLVLQDQLLGLGDAGVRLGLIVLDDEFDVHPAKLAAMFVKVHLEAVDHILADLGEDAGHRRDVTDAQFFGAGLRGRNRGRGQDNCPTASSEACLSLSFLPCCHDLPEASQEGLVASFFKCSSLP